MVWHDVYDYGCTGRGITRPGQNARGLTGAIEKLAQVSGPRQQEFAALDRRLRGEPGAAPLVGNRQFWCSDIMVQRRPGYYTSARMYSTRTLSTDGYINGENKKSHHLADGATYIFRTGEEYRDIFPVWDWKRIPGTTCEHSAAPMDPHKVQQRGRTRFVGGVSDGMYGAAAMDLERDGLSARKAWFYFDDEFVCLGAAITSTTGAPILTSVNQCLLKGPVITSNGPAPLRDGSAVEEAPGGWVLHDGIGYLFPGSANGGVIHVQNQVQTGSWAEIGVGSPAPVSLPVFSVWIDHGVKPVNASYEYIVVPGATAESLAAGRADDPVEILSNTTALQAVRQTKLKMVEAVFSQAGKLSGGAGWNIGVDQPCLLLLRETADGVEISAANPDNQPLGVNVTVDRDLTGDGATAPPGGTQIHFELPAGPEAGQSVTRTLRVR
ncbi:MAG TPA: polysaccharide lyase family 8 super-sandwich domain-containing protein [Armatimonadota bacterium]|nr:polysaccharide lyase family 8 super-sandwich domain-containing protein [Armatimonadota bacterium]